MKNIRINFFLQCFLMSIIVVSMIIPFGYWLIHPELTQMQVSLKLWWVILIGIMSGLIDMIILNYKK